MQKASSAPSFVTILIAHRKQKKSFFVQINKLIDWGSVTKVIDQHYTVGQADTGRTGYAGIILFKMSLLQYWYGLSDYEVEEQCNDSISFSSFIEVALDEAVPDHSVLSRFRTALTKVDAWEKLFDEINRQLIAHNIIVNTGSIVDAAITESPRKPKGTKNYEVVTDREEDATALPAGEKLTDGLQKVTRTTKLVERAQSGVDTDGRWIKKRGRLYYGYKKHVAVDEEGMVQAVNTTSANESDTKNLPPLVRKVNLEKQAWVKGDKGYRSQNNVDFLQGEKLKSHIMHKAVRGKALTERQKEANRMISKIRYKVERAFGGMKRWGRAGIARYVGLAKMHSQHLLEAMSYNLYRSPNIYIKNEIANQNQQKLIASS